MIGITMSSCASAGPVPASPARARGLAVALALTLAIAAPASAQSGSEDTTQFGKLGQGGVTYVNPAVPAPYNIYQQYSVSVAPNACVPTSTANGLTYLENYAVNTLGIADPFKVTPNSFAQATALATAMNTFNLTNTTNANNGPFTNFGGTFVPNMFNGLQSYLATNNPAGNVTISGEADTNFSGGTFNAGTNFTANTIPTVAYLAGLLNAHDAVEFWIQWGTYNSDNVFTDNQGAHAVTLTSIKATSATSGTIGFYDPWGDPTSPTAGNTASLQDGIFSANYTIIGGYIDLTYSTVVDINDDRPNPFGTTPDVLSGAGPNTGRIVVVMAEAVPEPSSLALVLTALPGWVGVRFVRRRAAARRAV